MLRLLQEREQEPIVAHDFAARALAPGLGVIGSLQRRERTLNKHRGCVNTISFTNDGTRLISGSDDLHLIVWDWQKGEEALKWDSGHIYNVFQAKTVGYGNNTIVSCARDGQVRMHLLSSMGRVKSRRIGRHADRSAHKLAKHPAAPHVFYSSGEDGDVRRYDIRERNAGSEKILTVFSATRRRRAHGPVELNSIHCNPAAPHEFVVGGSEEWSSIYDARMLGGGGGGGGSGGGVPIQMPVARFCPAHLVSDGPGTSTHITCSMFSQRGELLVQYSRDDVYLIHPWLQGKRGEAPIVAGHNSEKRTRSHLSAEAPSASRSPKREHPSSPHSAKSEDAQAGLDAAVGSGEGTGALRVEEPTRLVWPRRADAVSAQAHTSAAHAGTAYASGQGGSQERNDAGAAAAQSLSGDFDALLSKADKQLQGLQRAAASAGQDGGVAAATPSGRRARQKAARAQAGRRDAGGARAQREGKRQGRGNGRRLGRGAPVDDDSGEMWGQPAAPAFEAESDFGSLDSDESGGVVDANVVRTAGGDEGGGAPASSSEEDEASSSSSEDDASEEEEDNDDGGVPGAYEWTWRYRGRLEAHERQLAASQAAAPTTLHECLFDNCSAEPSAMWLNPGTDCIVQRFQGRENILTVKGVNFFGPRDEYVVSGSDCGHLYVWSKIDGCLRRMARGDSHYLNCVEPHPFLPLTMATSGIDNDIKIWEPRAQDEAPLPNTAEADRLWDERHEERMEALRLCGRNLNRRFRTHRHESPFFSLFGGYYGSV